MIGMVRLRPFFSETTLRLVNRGGQLMNPNEEAEESENVIEPPILPEVPFYKQ